MTKSCNIRAATTLLLLLSGSAAAQQPDGSDFVFDDGSLAIVRIEMDPALRDHLFADGNQYSDDELLASFTFERGGQVFSIDSIGFRLRGNTSRDSQKKSFKVSFNTFRRGGKFFGLEKLNLNGEHNDPTIMRSKVGWDLFNDLGIPASRANHIRLYINGDYYGLYVNVEHVDEQFVDRHYGNSSGNLYKCLWPADLAWLGPGPEPYRPVDASRRPYDLKLKDDDLLGYEDLADFISVLNNTSDATFADEIQQAFDVNGFLRALAVTVLTGSWDSYWFLKNNYYLYWNPDRSRFEFIPFDFDNIMGIWWDGIWPGLDWSTRDVYDWGHPDPGEIRPLTSRLLAVPEFRDRYTFYLKRTLESFDRTLIEPEVQRIRDQILVAAVEDTFRTLDYGYTGQDFLDAYEGPLRDHVVEGLLPFIDVRRNSALAQLDDVNVVPIISDETIFPKAPRAGGTVTVRARVEDEAPAPTVILRYRAGDTNNQTTPMNPVQGATDLYQATVTVPAVASFFDYQIVAIDPANQTATTTLKRLEVGGAVPLRINEFMASNLSSHADEFGEFDDWLEIYNQGSAPISLGGFFLTDTLGWWNKWALPDTTIPAGGFLVVWADEDGPQGPMHANFRLARSGEEIGLFDSQGALIDTIRYGLQEIDVSYGRLPDGSDTFAFFVQPTPGLSNSTGVGIEDPKEAALIEAYPNPFRDRLTVTTPDVVLGGRLEVFDVIGRRVISVDLEPGRPGPFVWDLSAGSASQLPAGVYLVRISIDRSTRTLMVVHY